MSSSNDESIKHSWDAVLQELIDKGEVSEDVLHDSDTIMRWWKSLDSAKQAEITSRVKELSQGQEVRTTETEKQRYQKESKVTKWYRKPRYIVLGIVIAVFCFVPVIDMSYDVVVQKEVEEEYTTVEPYTVLEEVEEMGRTLVPRANPSWTESTYTWVPVPRTVTKEVTKYREVTKTRIVTRPVAETQTKRVSILRYLLR